MTTQRILLLSYIVLGLLVSMAIGHLISASLGSIGVLSPYLSHSSFGVKYFNSEDFWSLFIGVIIGGAATIWCWVDPRVKVPAIQVVEELQRVTWPTFHETRSATFAVIVASLICAAILGLFDYGWGAVTSHIYAAP